MWSELLPFAAPGGAVAVLTGAVWMVLTGRLIPASTHERELANRDRQIVRLIAENDALVKQRDGLLELAQVTVGIVRALPAAKDSVS